MKGNTGSRSVNLQSTILDALARGGAAAKEQFPRYFPVETFGRFSRCWISGWCAPCWWSGCRQVITVSRLARLSGVVAAWRHTATAPDSPVATTNSETQQVETRLRPLPRRRISSSSRPPRRCSRPWKCETRLLLSLLSFGRKRGRSFCPAFLGKKG